MLSNSYLIFYNGSVCFITQTDVNALGSLLAAKIEPLPVDQVRLRSQTVQKLAPLQMCWDQILQETFS